jgi:thioredoxin-dependent peroxiredoxin
VTIRVGTTAPPFSLPGIEGSGASGGRRHYDLAEFAGQVVVLVFYPADASPVCTAQLGSYTNDIDRFAAVDAQVLAISPQRLDDHEAFARSQGGFAFPLLSDEDRAVGARYGVLGPMGFYRRSVFVIDAGGLVRYAHRSTAGLTFRPVAELVAAAQAAQSPFVV